MFKKLRVVLLSSLLVLMAVGSSSVPVFAAASACNGSQVEGTVYQGLYHASDQIGTQGYGYPTIGADFIEYHVGSGGSCYRGYYASMWNRSDSTTFNGYIDLVTQGWGCPPGGCPPQCNLKTYSFDRYVANVSDIEMYTNQDWGYGGPNAYWWVTVPHLGAVQMFFELSWPGNPYSSHNYCDPTVRNPTTQANWQGGAQVFRSNLNNCYHGVYNDLFVRQDCGNRI